MSRNMSAALSFTAAAAVAAAAAVLAPRTADAAGDTVPSASTAKVAGAPLQPADLRAEYKASRNEVSAMTGEDSGSVYLKLHPAAGPTAAMGAGPERVEVPPDAAPQTAPDTAPEPVPEPEQPPSR